MQMSLNKVYKYAYTKLCLIMFHSQERDVSVLPCSDRSAASDVLDSTYGLARALLAPGPSKHTATRDMLALITGMKNSHCDRLIILDRQVSDSSTKYNYCHEMNITVIP